MDQRRRNPMDEYANDIAHLWIWAYGPMGKEGARGINCIMVEYIIYT